MATFNERFTKTGAVQFMIAAFCGGMVLSLLELYHMMLKKESADAYFFGGMFIAGIMGVIVYILTNPNNIQTALMCGVGGPQFLGGFTKAVAATNGEVISSLFPYPTKVFVTLLFPFLTTAEAHPNNGIQHVHKKKVDSINVIVSVEGSEKIKLQTKDSSYTLSGLEKLTIPKQDSIQISGENIKQQTVSLYKLRDKVKEKIGREKKEFFIKVSIQSIEVVRESKSRNLLRGMFAQQKVMDDEPIVKKQMEIMAE